MRTDIRFFLNGRPRRVEDVAPHVTVLDWLRSESLTAAKEGCAEGDCGACSVLLGTPNESADGLEWRVVTSCILMLPQLDGLAVVTAEGLGSMSGADDPIHPAQRLLAEKHGTQCGYCSPGFAVALAALSRTRNRDDESIMDMIAGNLCRCTGYRPILDAARELPFIEASPGEAEMARDLIAECSEPLDYRAEGRRFIAPDTIESLLDLLAEMPDAWILSGGTDLGLRLTKHGEEPEFVLSLARVPELHGISRGEGETTIGAAVSYTDALETIAEIAPSFGDMIRRIGAAQIRAMGTIGGNIGTASPIGDTLPPLMALDAEVEIASRTEKRTVGMDCFITGYRETVLMPGEIIAAIRIPNPPSDRHMRVYKIARRIDQDISAVSAAFSLDLDNGKVTRARIAFGGVADRPLRATAVEDALVGRDWTNETARELAPFVLQSISPMDDARGSADYRRNLCVNLLERFWWETAGPEGGPYSLEQMGDAA
ncbi:MAG: xanthine dehydrogenase small subunit [Rhodospirillales bacterium]|nr:xanthine dehydrogenase small subunit [Rhodospirillales bacterium]